MRERRRAANQKRAHSAWEYMRTREFGDDGMATGPLGAIIELQSKEGFARYADPKQAPRLGCARAGVVTQFIAAYSSSDEARRVARISGGGRRCRLTRLARAGRDPCVRQAAGDLPDGE